MIYLVHTIKELSTSTINTDFVIEVENENEIKELMSEYKIIVLGITKVAGRPNAGQFFGEIQTKSDKKIKFCLKTESLEEACRRCIDLELPIISLNDILHPISAQESNTMIFTLRGKKEKTITEQKALETQVQEERKMIMDDKRKKKIMTVVGETLHDISVIEDSYDVQLIGFDKKKHLHDLKEMLTKIKMGSNLEKATSVLEETFVLLEQIETDNLSQMKEQEQQIMSSSIISNIDIIGELDKIKRANQTDQAGTKKNSSDLYYTYLGLVGLYQKFIIKDIVNKFLEFKKLIVYSIEHITFGLIIMSISLGGIVWYRLIYNHLDQHLLSSMMIIGLLGITREIPSFGKKGSVIMNIIYIILAIIVSIGIHRLLIINFALV